VREGRWKYDLRTHRVWTLWCSEIPMKLGRRDLRTELFGTILRALSFSRLAIMPRITSHVAINAESLFNAVHSWLHYQIANIWFSSLSPTSPASLIAPSSNRSSWRYSKCEAFRNVWIAAMTLVSCTPCRDDNLTRLSRATTFNGIVQSHGSNFTAL